MKTIIHSFSAVLALLLFTGCQTAAEKEIAKHTLPKDHPLPRLVSFGTPYEMATSFLSSKLSANSRNAAGAPLLVLAAARGDVNIIQFLLDKGADKEAADLNGCRALHAASSCGHVKAVQLLLKYGANPDAPGSHGRTPLMEAVRTCGKDAAELLLRGGAKVNLTDAEGRTALMHALSASRDEPGIAELLLRHGADSTIVDKEGNTALMYGALRGNPKSTLLLLKGIPDFTSGREALGLLIMKCAIDGKNPELVKTLIRKKVPLNWNRSFAHNMLRKVKMHGLYRILVRKGVFDKRRSPLMWAALNNDKELVELLLTLGADPLQKDENGNSAYDLATRRDVISTLKRAEKLRIKKMRQEGEKPLFRSKLFQ